MSLAWEICPRALEKDLHHGLLDAEPTNVLEEIPKSTPSMARSRNTFPVSCLAVLSAAFVKPVTTGGSMNKEMLSSVVTQSGGCALVSKGRAILKACPNECF